jgi:hypothetical protein
MFGTLELFNAGMVQLPMGPISHSASACFKEAKKFCSYECANLLRNWPLKSDV